MTPVLSLISIYAIKWKRRSVGCNYLTCVTHLETTLLKQTKKVENLEKPRHIDLTQGWNGSSVCERKRVSVSP